MDDNSCKDEYKYEFSEAWHENSITFQRINSYSFIP